MPSKSDSDEELLKSGLFADVTVQCGPREWKLHKAILCTRSKWFRKALCGNFLEAQTSEVNLQEQDPDSVDAMISWIYTEDLKPLAGDDEDIKFTVLAELYTTAHFFLLDGFQTEIVTYLGECLRKRAILVQKQFCQTNDHKNKDFLDDQVLRGIQAGLETAYLKGFQELCMPYVQFVGMTFYWVLQAAEFEKTVDAVPEFGLAVLKAVTSSVSHGRYITRSPPDRCETCHETAKWSDGEWHWGRIGEGSRKKVNGICYKCNGKKITW